MKEAFVAISKWEVDPRDEDMKRLFFQKGGAESVLTGKRNIIIGRKGSGKTSIAEYILQTSRPSTRIFNLSEINFSEIDEFLAENTGEGMSYNLFWRYIIYYIAIEIMTKGKHFDYKTTRAIKSVVNVNSDTDFMKRVSYLRKLDFKLSAFGVEASVSADRSFAQLSLSERCGLLEGIIARYSGPAQISIIFDELDSQFRMYDKNTHALYHEAVKSLLITALDVKRRLPKLNPIILIRDDIFDLITKRFSESNKLIDKTFYLKWSQKELIGMCNHRLATDSASASDVFSGLFADSTIISKLMRHKNRKLVSMVDFFFEHTMLRPRDVILLLREIAQVCLDSEVMIASSNVFRTSLPRYSLRFKQELVDEIFGSIDNISEVFDVITESKATRFRSDGLVDIFIDHLDINEKEARKILDILFYFSVVGLAEGSVTGFRYLDERARYVPDVNVELHPGIRDAIKFFDQYAPI